MLGIGKTLSWIFLVVVFVVLAGLATTFYNADKIEQDKIINNDLVKKSQSIINLTTDASAILAENKLEKNFDLGNKLLNIVRGVGNFFLSVGKGDKLIDSDNIVSEIEAELVERDGEQLINKQSADKFKEFLTDGTGLLTDGQSGLELGKLKELTEGPSFKDFIKYQKNTSGAEIILKTENGPEYKISLPFKFLAE